ncbi:MAG TPA: pitrilysin family protein [Desulfuromonadales bacterium]|nr:pitrilysin family protein [Desulfuromonadales bacterium]
MVEKSTLDNGIRVVSEQMPGVHSVTLGIWVTNGSRHESSVENGISHFIEHMLFKGTRRRDAQAIAKEIDSVGGVLNGFTAREYSCYYAKVLAEKLSLAVDLLSDIILNSSFHLDEMEKERKVLLQEISMVEDTPDDQIHDLFSQMVWEGHPLGLSVLGTRETVGSLCRDDLLAFLEQRYCGCNILICAAGQLEHSQLVDAVSTAFRSVPRGRPLPQGPLPTYQRRMNVVEKDLEQVHICLGTQALPQNHPQRFDAYILNAILGSSMSSRLFQTIREERGLAYSIYSYLNCHSDAGALVAYAGTSPGDALDAVSLMLKELNRFKIELVSEDELSAAKEQLKGHLLLSLENTDNRMTRLAKNEIYLDRNMSLQNVLDSFDRVDRQDVQRLAEFIFQDDFLNLQLIGKISGRDFPLLDLTLG